MINLGDFKAGATVHLKWNSNDGNGASITRSTDGSIRLYKGSSDVQRTSAAGITDTENFDSLTGVHHLSIDLSENTDAGFYAVGNDYQIVLVGAVIDTQTVNACLAQFSIENRAATVARAEPAQGAPAATLSPQEKLGYLFKSWRNRKTQTATTLKIFADDATTVDHKSTVSDDSTTLDVGEIATGP